MKKTWTITDILNQYRSSCDIMNKATLDGDYKANNREGKKITMVFKYLEKNLELAETVLPLLFSDSNVVTRTKAAAHCLALGIHVSEAEKLLLEDSEKQENGIFGFNAKMTLKVWKEKGCLRIYQE